MHNLKPAKKGHGYRVIIQLDEKYQMFLDALVKEAKELGWKINHGETLYLPIGKVHAYYLVPEAK